MTEARVWHEEKKTQDWKEHYVILQDGDQTISFILKHNKATNTVIAEPFTPPDIDYTIHDGCNHDDDACVLDDPDSPESQDVEMASGYALAISALEKQVKQQRIAEQLLAEKKKLPAESETEINALLEKLPANYPPARLTKAAGYTLEIDHTIIFRDVTLEEAIKHTRNYVDARREHPNMPIGVIYGIYD
jgi:hypothetical protein